MGSKGRFIDLHIHTSFSDGSHSPESILNLAVEAGLAAIAITDHDTVQGACQALLSGIPENLCFAAGVEISASLPPPFQSAGALHLLGYFFDPENAALSRGLEEVQQARRDRNPRIVDRLRSLGVDITYEEVKAASGGGQVGRPHFARVLMEKKVVGTVQEAFDRFLAKGRPAFEEKKRMPALDAIRLLRKAGGIPVLAHPSSLEMANDELFRLISLLGKQGLGGLETLYPGHTPEMVQTYSGMASELGLLVTGGTDFHGSIKPDIKLGVGDGTLRVPFSLFENLEKARPQLLAS